MPEPEFTYDAQFDADEKWVIVCDHCKRASCWQGIFLCEDAKTAGFIEVQVRELKKAVLESSEYWK